MFSFRTFSLRLTAADRAESPRRPGLHHVHTPSPSGQTTFISALVRALPSIT